MKSRAVSGNWFSAKNCFTSTRNRRCSSTLRSASVSISRSSRNRNSRSSRESMLGQEFGDKLPVGGVGFAVPTVPTIFQLGKEGVHLSQRTLAHVFRQIRRLQDAQR